MRNTSMSLLVFATTIIGVAQAHMSPFARSMYGVGGSRTGQDWNYTAGDPVSPIGPGVATQDAWWFRGPSYRSLAPPAGQVTLLPAGGSVVLEIACHVAFTSYGWATTVPGSALDACPGSTAGPFHSSSNSSSSTIDPTLLSGCALAIANVDDITKTTMDNLVIFSVQPNCVQTKLTSFDIPAMMPACTGAKCVCGWFWLANTGTANFYMTAFDCNVTNVSPQATALAAPRDPVYCAPGDSSCTPTAGAKRPLYAYNSPTNCAWKGDPALFNTNRPGYHASWSFSNGAQNDIFLPRPAVVSSKVSSTRSRTAIGSTTAAASQTKTSSSLKVSSSSKRATTSSSLKTSSSVKARTTSSTASKARRTLDLSPEDAPSAAHGTAPAQGGDDDAATHQASRAILEQLRDAKALAGQFEEQEWGSAQRGV